MKIEIDSDLEIIYVYEIDAHRYSRLNGTQQMNFSGTLFHSKASFTSLNALSKPNPNCGVNHKPKAFCDQSAFIFRGATSEVHTIKWNTSRHDNVGLFSINGEQN